MKDLKSVHSCVESRAPQRPFSHQTLFKALSAPVKRLMTSTLLDKKQNIKADEHFMDLIIDNSHIGLQINKIFRILL